MLDIGKNWPESEQYLFTLIFDLLGDTCAPIMAGYGSVSYQRSYDFHFDCHTIFNLVVPYIYVEDVIIFRLAFPC